MVTKVAIEQALSEKDIILLDTRTPKEFQEDHLPNAINLPLLSNEERAVVGTVYKQVSQEKAIEQGIEFFSQKMPEFMKEAAKYKGKKIIVYCWRGGMRSRTVVSLLESFGYHVRQLDGGYKKYREYVRERLYHYSLRPKCVLLWGLTCTGKTQLLQKFQNSLDLEGLAQHRGSLYGAIGLQPRSQKMFENLMLQRLEQLNSEKFMLVEGESRRIGDVIIPNVLWKAMMNGIHVRVTRSLERRAEEAAREYIASPKDVEKIKEITLSLSRVISNKHKQEIVALLDQKKYIEAIKILLEQYYDPLYSNTLKHFQFVFEINNDRLAIAVRELKQKILNLA
ncbi:tRNA 2-selenouridine(34) synthase MnmH [Candidatus Woesearchaeota archaeon]|nr:tRNA 2-selenouridine(34) synthase MnmH [Candidatus Woesearchaeota archaeon]